MNDYSYFKRIDEKLLLDNNLIRFYDESEPLIDRLLGGEVERNMGVFARTNSLIKKAKRYLKLTNIRN